MTENLLITPTIQTNRGALTLPGLFAAMARGEVTDFPGLRPHQRPAWHMFLVQLAVLARSDQNGTLPEDEETWRANLRALTPEFDDDAPWHLIVEDLAKPAFLQPPDPGGLKWSDVATPDALDMLITSRNHDLKREIAHNATPQDWLFALVSLQTMEGFGGAGNYGIARMNGGSSSRAMIGLAPAHLGSAVINASTWWQRDVLHLSAARKAPIGPALIWCLPWPEKQMLDLHVLDPMFIEVCRRVRLREGPHGMHAKRATSKAPRISAKEAKGMTGDPWAPIHLAESKSLTLGEQDWSYKLINRLLYSGEWKAPELAASLPEEGSEDMALIAEAFARGNSKTDGFKSRVIPIPKAVVKHMLGPKAIAFSQEQIERIGDIDHALRDGLALIAAEGDYAKRGKAEYARSQPARAQFARLADAVFFPALWDKLGAETQEGRIQAQNRFVRKLAKAARAEFIRAAPAIPCTGIMRPRADTRGRTAFEAAIRKIFRTLGTEEKEHV
ncbi:CRISPR-associated protein Cse1 [Celeribacter baekdonensis]|uniref:CRISPR-associated protein Cse1 n=1 Tax=Celeribacter baekdonensis TaxID=875171 RepID=UPI00131EF5A4|nr:CRISPR-associated protein Cse1 [Celeribacter baekdonensis]